MNTTTQPIEQAISETLPRTHDYHERQADRLGIEQDDMEAAIASALHHSHMFPERYADLMVIIEGWLVSDHISCVGDHFSHGKPLRDAWEHGLHVSTAGEDGAGS